MVGDARPLGGNEVLDRDIEAGALEQDSILGQFGRGDRSATSVPAVEDGEHGRNVLGWPQAHQVLIEWGVAFDRPGGQVTELGIRAAVGNAIAFKQRSLGVEVEAPVGVLRAEHGARVAHANAGQGEEQMPGFVAEQGHVLSPVIRPRNQLEVRVGG